MNELIQRIVLAIIRQEGAPRDSTNPGNIRKPVWLTGPYATQNGFWLPVTRNCGVAGLAHIVALHIAEGDSLEGFLGGHAGYPGYAPAGDHNDVEAYITNVMKWAAVPNRTSPMWEFLL